MFVKSIPSAVKSDGTKIAYEPGLGYKLTAGLWYIDVSLPDPVNESVHVTWDAVLAGTVSYQDSNLPAYKSESAPYTDSSAPVDVAINDATSGNWMPQNLTTGSVATTAGATVTTGVLTIAGGTAGGARFDIVDAARRGRIATNISTGGYLRVHAHGKQA